MQEIQTQIETKFDTLMKGIVADQEIMNRNKSRLDALDQIQFDKISENNAKSLEEITQLKAKMKTYEAGIKSIERSISTVAGGNVTTNNDIEMKCKDEFCRYIRLGSAMSEETVKYVSNHIINTKVFGLSTEKKNHLTKDLVEGSNPAGGYLVRPDVDKTMTTRFFETSPMRNFATIQTTTSNSVERLIDDDETSNGGWVGEVSSRPKTNTPTIGKLQIPVMELFEQPAATQRILDDVADLESWLMDKVLSHMSRTENTSFIIGDGSQKPKGILDYPAWAAEGVYERSKIERSVSSVSLLFSGDDLIKLQNLVLEPYQANAVWFLNRRTWRFVEQAKDGVGRYLLNPNLLYTGVEPLLLGHKVQFMSDMPTVDGSGNFAADQLVIAYGDFKVGYTIYDRLGFRIIRDDVTNKPFILFYTTKRVGGDVSNYESYKILQIKP